jgi:ATP-binding cassette, subfamily B (MDR/TAP), member 1
MEKGLETYVGANGAQLSGGQKQRIAIARALCKNPQVLILDEATSALDRRNEKEIQETLHNLSEADITTIVIAHRLSTVKDADKIYVLDRGELVEEGNHEQLLRVNGVYARLVHTQIQLDQKYLEEKEEQEEGGLPGAAAVHERRASSRS